jgi:hypothetical protein
MDLEKIDGFYEKNVSSQNNKISSNASKLLKKLKNP